MKGKTSMALLGLFVLVSITLACIMLLNLKGKGLFNNDPVYHVHVDRSLKGLNVGAMVTFRGVKIGQVTQIKLMPDSNLMSVKRNNNKIANGLDPLNTVEANNKIPEHWPLEIDFTIDYKAVSFNFEEDDTHQDQRIVRFKNSIRDYMDNLSPKEHVDNWLTYMVKNNNMAAKLKVASILTGQMYIELDFDKSTPVTEDELNALASGEIPLHETALDKLRTTFDSRETIESLTKSVKIFSETINSGKLEATIDNIHNTVKTINDTAMTANNTMTSINQKLNPILDNTNTLVKTLQAKVVSMEKSTNELSAELKKLAIVAQKDLDMEKGPFAQTLVKCNQNLTQLNETLVNANIILASLQYNQSLPPTTQTSISRLIIQLEESARSAKELTDMLRETPEVLIKGK